MMTVEKRLTTMKLPAILSMCIFQVTFLGLTLFTSLITETVSTCDDGTCPSVGFYFVQSGANVVHDSSLYGHGFHNLTVTDPRECFKKCSSDCRCISFNCQTNAKPNNCQLNEENRHLSPDALKPRLGFNYYDLVIDYNIQAGQTSCECNNHCCKTQKCQNGGTCLEMCDENRVRFTCLCSPAYTGKYCETQKAWETCHEARSRGITTSGIYNHYSAGLNVRPCYCDFDSEEGSSWTLIESFSLANKGVHNLSFYTAKSSMNTLYPTNWQSYRLSRRRRQSIRDYSTHWRATCNFEKDGAVYTDYLRARLEDNDIMAKPKQVNGFCARYEIVNIRGKSCVNCTALTFHHSHLHIDSYYSGDECDFNGTDGANIGEDNFGSYLVTNPLFRCTTFQNSTTQFWIGNL